MMGSYTSSMHSILLLVIIQLYLSITHSYHISSIPLNYTEALNYCQTTHNTTLATVYTPEQNTIISQLCSSQDTEDCWIGLKYDMIDLDWKWSKNNMTVGYQAWFNTPNIGQNPKCAKMILFDDQWDDVVCTAFNLAICNDFGMFPREPLTVFELHINTLCFFCLIPSILVIKSI